MAGTSGRRELGNCTSGWYKKGWDEGVRQDGAGWGSLSIGVGEPWEGERNPRSEKETTGSCEGAMHRLERTMRHVERTMRHIEGFIRHVEGDTGSVEGPIFRERRPKLV